MNSRTLHHPMSLVSSPSIRTALGVIAYAIGMAAAAQVYVPLPGTPVPMTLQTVVVLLAGLRLGATPGALSAALYLAGGAVGLPFFAGSHGFAALMGPTGGYLIGFVLAAWTMGRLRSVCTGLTSTWLAAFAASLTVFVPGVLHLHFFNLSLGYAPSFSQTLLLGLVPFLFPDIVKVSLVATLARLTSR